MRVVGRPEDLARADIVGKHREASLDRLEGNPAIAAEQIARTCLQPGIIEALIVEMAVHPIEPRCDPASSRLEETDAQLRMTLDDAAPDHAHSGEHHLHRVRNDVLSAAPLEAVDADGGHVEARSLMDADRHVELFRLPPEWLVDGIV